MAAVATLHDLRDLEAGAAYPGFVLEGAETALIMFAAGFLGKQDAYWIAEAGIRARCVDEDLEKLGQMRDLYPADWSYRVADVFEWSDTKVYDIVSLDPWTQDFQRCADMLGKWCAIAGRAVVLGTGVGTRVEAPDGWHVSDVRRRSDYDGGVFWHVLEPES